jgi:hypothetical protein
VERWQYHPAFDWCLIPDIVDGDEEENKRLVYDWHSNGPVSVGVPVWHLNESLDYLLMLMDDFPRVALGSSGQYVNIGTQLWWNRMAEAMEILCFPDGRPKVKIHGLRQMDPAVFSVVPYSSVDSTNVARNIGLDCRWTGSYVPKRKETRAMLLRDNIEHHAASARWPGIGGIQRNLEIFG